MFTLLDNKAVINSYTTLRQEREKHTTILKENVCVCHTLGIQNQRKSRGILSNRI